MFNVVQISHIPTHISTKNDIPFRSVKQSSIKVSQILSPGQIPATGTWIREDQKKLGHVFLNELENVGEMLTLINE
jgi:hypothetical protein